MDPITFLGACFTVGCVLGLTLVVLALVISHEFKEKRLSRVRANEVQTARKARLNRVY